MRRVLIAAAATAALLTPTAALAGGWATVGLAPPPQGVDSGETWRAEMTILQHGQTPLEGVAPTLTIKNGATTKSFAAKPTDEAGVYVAEVVFPTRGKWSYVVNDGFSATHSFAAVTIPTAAAAAAAAPADDGGIPVLPIAVGMLLLLVAAFAFFLLARRTRVRAPAPTH